MNQEYIVSCFDCWYLLSMSKEKKRETAGVRTQAFGIPPKLSEIYQTVRIRRIEPLYYSFIQSPDFEIYMHYNPSYHYSPG